MEDSEDVGIGTVTIQYGGATIQYVGTEADGVFLSKLLARVERRLFLAGCLTGGIAANAVWLLATF